MAAAYNNSSEDAAALLCPGARNAAENNSGAAYVFSSADVDTAAPTKNGAPCISSLVRATAAQGEDVTVYLDYGTPAAESLELPRVTDLAAGRGGMLLYPFHQTTATAHRNSGMVAGELLPVASQVRP